VNRLALVLLVGLLGVGMVLLVLAVLERQLGKRQLSRTLAAIEQAGDTLEIAVLRPPAVPASSNAWSALLPYTNRLMTVPDALRNPPPLWAWSSPGKLVPLGTATSHTHAVGAETNQANAMAAMREALAEGADLLGTIHQALDRADFDGGFPYDQGFFALPGETTVLFSAGRWLHAESCLGLIDGDGPVARRGLVSLLRLLQHQRRQPHLIGQLTRYNLATRAMELTVHGLRDERLFSQADLGELHDAWARLDILADFEQALLMERAIGWQHSQLVATNRVRRTEAIGWADETRKTMELEEEPLWERAWRTCVQEPLWPWLWTAHDTAWNLTHWNHRIAAARLARTNSWKDASFDISALDVQSGFLKDIPMEGVRGPRWVDKLRCRFSLGGPSLFADYHFFRTAYRAETARRLAMAALRVHRFQREHGRWPEELMDAYASAGGEGPPLDPMDGKPLRYRRPGNDGFLLYSDGTDGKDNGGSLKAEDKGAPNRTPFDAEDWVWPQVIR